MPAISLLTGPFLEGALTSSDGGESWSGPFNVDGRPSRDAVGGYGDNEDSKGGFAPPPIFTNDGRLVTIGNGGPGNLILSHCWRLGCILPGE